MFSFIKWTGSKRSQVDWILSKVPDFSGTFYEPFLGSGIVLLSFLKEHRNVKCVGSDICKPLILLWQSVRDEPMKLVTDYKIMWNCYNSKDENYRKEYFNRIRTEFNIDYNSSKFLFLQRTSINGLVRFNSKGKYNSTSHFSRPGIEPNKLEKIILECSELIQNTYFMNVSYDKIVPNKNDFIYMDPPYAFTGKSMYYGGIDSKKYYDWVKQLPCKWLMSYDGTLNGKNIYEIPNDIYKHKYISNSKMSSSYNVHYGAKNGVKRIIADALYSNFDEKNILTIDDF